MQWRRQWHPTPVLLPGKSHGWRSLKGCSPWGRWGSDTTERLHFHVSLSCIGEGNANPLQCCCLENPRDRGAWWAAISGVAQSRTRLKWLSSVCKCPKDNHMLKGYWSQLVVPSAASGQFEQWMEWWWWWSILHRANFYEFILAWMYYWIQKGKEVKDNPSL